MSIQVILNNFIFLPIYCINTSIINKSSTFVSLFKNVTIDEFYK